MSCNHWRLNMLQLKVPDMTCGHCEKTIRNALSVLPGIKKLEIDLPGKILRIEGKPDSAAIRRAISESGYTPE